MEATWPGTRTQRPSRRRSVPSDVGNGHWTVAHPSLGSRVHRAQCAAHPPSPWGMCVCAFSQGVSPETPCSLQSEPSHDLHLALHPEPVALPRTAPAQGSLLAPSPRARASPLHGWLMSNSTCPGLGSSPFPCGKVSIC